VENHNAADVTLQKFSTVFVMTCD